MPSIAHPYALEATDAPALTLIEGSRGKPDMLVVRATEIADLIDELTAAGQDMVAMASRLAIAASSGRLDLVAAIAERLGTLGEMYAHCTDPEQSA
jgi:hypothetical protein